MLKGWFLCYLGMYKGRDEFYIYKTRFFGRLDVQVSFLLFIYGYVTVDVV